MLLSREGGLVAYRSTILKSFYVQAVLGFFFIILLPAIVGFLQLPSDDGAIAPFANSIAGAAIAFASGLAVLRRVTAFPGIRDFGYILPSYLASFGGIVATMFIFRLDYSRGYILSSLTLSIIFSYVLGFIIERLERLKFWVVPFGKISELLKIDGVDWCMMDAPKVPTTSPAAIVADLRFDHEPEWERMLAEAAVGGRRVYHTKQLRESLTGRVSIEHLSENSFGSLLPNLAYVRIKRALDVLIVLILVPFLLLPMAFIAILIKLDSSGPIFFRQERVGYRGKRFWMFKFRTMRPRTAFHDMEAARNDAMTQSDDVRVTRIGRFLRKVRLDELPQLLNVLRGDMSIIGPRPEAVPLSAWYQDELAFYFYRHIVRPGITGWAQVQQGHVTDLDAVDKKLSYDFYYIKNFSAWLDMLIAMRTIPTMILGVGSK